jgi:hypothetical protein
MATTKPRPAAPKFRVLVGCSFPPREAEHNEPGSIVSDVPAYIVPTWLADGVIEPYADPDEAA